MEDVTYGQRIANLAAEHPAATAVTVLGPRGRVAEFSWLELELQTNIAARALLDLGVAPRDTVAIALPAGLDHVVATIAAWKLGALVVPLDATLTEQELHGIASLIGPHTLVSNDKTAAVPPGWWRGGQHSSAPLQHYGPPRSASLTGGTTGAPRVIMRPRPWTFREQELLAPMESSQGLHPKQTQLVVLQPHHSGFTALYHGIALDHRIVILERFIPTLVPEVIQKYRVNYVRLVATMMRLILDVPGLARYDLTSLEAVHHGAGPCPPKVKRAWIEMLGPKCIYEVYANQERVGWTVIRGDEWLEHPGSVGRSTPSCEIRIYDDHGNEAQRGEIGQVFMKTPGAGQPRYLGDGPLLAEMDGFLSVGDLGYLSADDYLYLVGRSDTLINVGGENVYPAEIESVLLRIPGVADAVVTGRPNEYLGQAVHAIVVPADRHKPVDISSIDAYCRAELSGARVPMTYELVESIQRRDNGKLNRSELQTLLRDQGVRDEC